MLVRIFRELSKLTMFIFIWGFPLYLAKTTGDKAYFWFFILSIVINAFMFLHYEDLERIDKISDLKRDKDEQRSIGESENKA